MQVDITRLRKLVAIRGLVTNGVSQVPAGRGMEGRILCCPACRRLLPCCPLRARCFGSTAGPDETASPNLSSPPACIARQLRSRVWPLLMGVDGPGPPGEAARYAVLARSTHKDSHVVECDMARSLWSYTEGGARAAFWWPAHPKKQHKRCAEGHSTIWPARRPGSPGTGSTAAPFPQSITQRRGPANLPPPPPCPQPYPTPPHPTPHHTHKNTHTHTHVATPPKQSTNHPPASPAGWAEEEREARRAALRRVLDATVAGNSGGVHYYQGLHDIAAVLLFVCGERAAHRLLRALAASHLRDCTRPDLAAATESLRLLYPILQQVGSGGPLGRGLRASELHGCAAPAMPRRAARKAAGLARGVCGVGLCAPVLGQARPVVMRTG